jgi:hypothetical protein
VLKFVMRPHLGKVPIDQDGIAQGSNFCKKARLA